MTEGGEGEGGKSCLLKEQEGKQNEWYMGAEQETEEKAEAAL